MNAFLYTCLGVALAVGVLAFLIAWIDREDVGS